jgi:hypothetical protein
MRIRGLASALCLSGGLVGFGVAACSLGVNGSAPVLSDASMEASVEASSQSDGSADGTVPVEDVKQPEDTALSTDAESIEGSAGDAGDGGDGAGCNAFNCPGACCGNKCVARTCAGCDVGSLFCTYNATIPNSNGQCVSSCATCNAFGNDGGVACFSCASSPPVGTCQATTSQCPKDMNGGACACSAGDGGACPGATQVCVSSGGGTCLSCGQPGTQGMSCAQGSSCNQTSAACSM